MLTDTTMKDAPEVFRKTRWGNIVLGDALDLLPFLAYNSVDLVMTSPPFGFGEPGSKDACLLFNILHCEQPVKLLAEAARVVRPSGFVHAIHWRYDPATPRGPSMGIRPCPEQIVNWAKEAGLFASPEGILDLPPWHYGIQFQRPGI